MKAYSHTDRVRFSHFLDPKMIQNVICNGYDLYNMLPEEYTFKDIIEKMGPISHSYLAIHLPSYLLNNADEYRYLLPSNCIREAG
ncbi:putative glycosyl transferase, family 17 [Helianthus annuus]|nr:putative glycosyl transferase, family 17 [Helianthus annuus]KAJ0834996.1 putative glycosyl transferase, family 17 [Helianthus annuus]